MTERESPLPTGYARFNRKDQAVDRYTTNLRTEREQEYFGDVYQNSWTTPCRLMDVPLHRQLAQTMRTMRTRDNREDYPQRQEVYWRGLTKGSVYPFFAATQEDLQRQQYGQSVINTWTNPQESSFLPDVITTTAKIYPYIFNRQLQSEAFRPRKFSTNNRHFYEQLDILQQQEKNPKPDLLTGYLACLQLATTARTHVLSALAQQIENQEAFNSGEITVSGTLTPQDKITQLLQQLEPYRYFADQLSERIQHTEQQLFKKQAFLAGTLWRAVVFMRTDEASRLGGIPTVREPLIRDLLRGNYQATRSQLKDLVAKRPNLLAEFVKERLEFEPEGVPISSEKTTSKPQTPNPKEIADRLMPLEGRQLSNPDGTIAITIQRYRGRASFSLQGHGLEQIFASLGRTLPRNRMLSATDLQLAIEQLGLTPQEEK